MRFEIAGTSHVQPNQLQKELNRGYIEAGRFVIVRHVCSEHGAGGWALELWTCNQNMATHEPRVHIGWVPERLKDKLPGDAAYGQIESVVYGPHVAIVVHVEESNGNHPPTVAVRPCDRDEMPCS